MNEAMDPAAAVIPVLAVEDALIAAAMGLGQEDADVPVAQELLDALTGRASELWLYRDRTAGILRRYGRLSVEVGRLPSLLGREFFRGRVTSYRVATFEDAVIFVHDVEQALDHLDGFDRQLIAKILLQDYSQDEAARLLRCGRRTVVRRFPEALDQISELFLAGGLLIRLPVTRPEPVAGPEPAPEAEAEKSCQEGESAENCLSDCE